MNMKSCTVKLADALGIEAEQISIEALPSERGYTADVCRAWLRAEGLPESVIVKCPASDPEKRGLAERFHSYRNEHRFYAELCHGLPVRVPVCLYHSPEPDDFLLVLEDLGAEGIISTSTGASYEQSLLAMETLARLHGHFRRGPPASQQPIEASLRAAAPDMQSFVLDALKSLPEQPGRELMIRYAKNSSDHIDLYSAQDQVFTHLDYRLDNLRFLTDGLVVLDWGESAFAPPGFDLANFMVNSIRVEDRREWETALLHQYCKTLNSTEDNCMKLRESYQLALLPAFYMAGLVMAQGDPEEGRELAHRCLSAIDDHADFLSGCLQ